MAITYRHAIRGDARALPALAGAILLSFAAGLACAQGAPDAPAAEALMKKQDCFQCHAAARKRDGPSFKEIVAKYKDKPRADAEAAMLKMLTTSPKVKVDGKEQEHDNVKSKNEADIRNVIRYILSF